MFPRTMAAMAVVLIGCIRSFEFTSYWGQWCRKYEVAKFRHLRRLTYIFYRILMRIALFSPRMPCSSVQIAILHF